MCRSRAESCPCALKVVCKDNRQGPHCDQPRRGSHQCVRRQLLEEHFRVRPDRRRTNLRALSIRHITGYSHRLQSFWEHHVTKNKKNMSLVGDAHLNVIYLLHAASNLMLPIDVHHSTNLHSCQWRGVFPCQRNIFEYS